MLRLAIAALAWQGHASATGTTHFSGHAGDAVGSISPDTIHKLPIPRAFHEKLVADAAVRQSTEAATGGNAFAHSDLRKCAAEEDALFKDTAPRDLCDLEFAHGRMRVEKQIAAATDKAIRFLMRGSRYNAVLRAIVEESATRPLTICFGKTAYYEADGHRIYWNPHMHVEMRTSAHDGVLRCSATSAAETLGHELFHAYTEIADPLGSLARSAIPDPEWGTIDERVNAALVNRANDEIGEPRSSNYFGRDVRSEHLLDRRHTGCAELPADENEMIERRMRGTVDFAKLIENNARETQNEFERRIDAHEAPELNRTAVTCDIERGHELYRAAQAVAAQNASYATLRPQLRDLAASAINHTAGAAEPQLRRQLEALTSARD